MLNFILRRVVQTIPVLIGISLLVFLFIHMIPGDPAIALLGERATPDALERIRTQLGLNKPLLLNLPYDVEYVCPEGHDGNVIDLLVTVIPSECTRQASYKDGWSVLRTQESRAVEAIRVVEPGTPNESTEVITELPRALRLIGVRTLEELDLQPGEAVEYETYNGTITIIDQSSSELFSDLFDSQYFSFVGRILRGDLGQSVHGNISISTELARRWPATIELSIAALLISIVIGVPIGILSAIRRSSWIDTLSMFIALIGVSLPIFVLGLLLIYMFSVHLSWLPSGQRLTSMTFQPTTNLLLVDAIIQGNGPILVDALQHLIMPAIALSTIPLAIIARITRSAMLEVLYQDYIRTARAKGLHEQLITVRHALRNAMLPVVTVIGLQMGSLLQGAVLTETIFSWPGIGKWIYEAIDGRDYPIVQSVTLVVAIAYVAINLAVDILYGFLDPRIRYQ